MAKEKDVVCGTRYLVGMDFFVTHLWQTKCARQPHSRTKPEHNMLENGWLLLVVWYDGGNKSHTHALYDGRVSQNEQC
jgi:hypothetical protein